MAFYQTLLSVALLVSSVAAYPRRPPNVYFQASLSTGTCASIGYTTGCCPPDNDCKATDSGDGADCYCSSDCHDYMDCCNDIVNICPSSPRTCTELGFIDRCCTDELEMGHCEIESLDCSCKSSCFVDDNCCPGIGCSPTTCTEARLDPGCCEGDCNVTYGPLDTDNCYCDERCRHNGDCCEDVNQTRQCNSQMPSCTPTTRPGNPQTKTQEARPRLQALEIMVKTVVRRNQNRFRKLMARSQAPIRPSDTQRAYVDKRNNMRERLVSLLETRRAQAQAQRNKRRY